MLTSNSNPNHNQTPKPVRLFNAKYRRIEK